MLLRTDSHTATETATESWGTVLQEGGGGGGVVDTDRPPGQGDNGTARVGRGRLVGGISPGALSRRGDRQEW